MWDCFTDADIQEEVDTFMFAGYDTTATAVLFTLYNLAIYPDIQRRCQNKIDHIFKEDSRFADSNDLAKMTFLEACIKESLR